MDTTAWFFLHLKAFGFALPRFLAVFTILPLLSREALPLTLRVAAIGSFAIFMAPMLAEGVALERPTFSILGLVLKEAFIGIVIGFVLAIPLWAVENMGDLVDAQRGATIAQTINPLSGHETSPLGQLFNQAIVTMMFSLGGFVMVLGVIYDSFQIWPVFGWWPHFAPEAPKLALDLLDRFMSLTVLLCAPVIFAMFLAEAGMAIISRFVPQLQVFFLAMPIKSAIAMVVFAIYGVVLFDYAGDLILETLRECNRTVFAMFKGVRLP
ncbi:EscT/YscT/HrcT family type III secretion system export apparatus protein [Caenimonas koreensis DSM 17982]|uniref:EscT/YscT/HrcT family type III secretion system export apparatus protein n=1 Tax=Caenimonas koreensis DSM 17982 TaxID=1121255 RepID=A0A844ASK2_9BURK|nr:type III secretion system export apparatus subunit SctT [Caenimonas koreensis]MRD47074.1 EscT/YscT/HrcT family type III secretion system export apparatus protein [Caenimonas koreensis DSM 17982]